MNPIDTTISKPYLSADPAVMLSSVCSKISTSKDTHIGVTCSDLNMKATQSIQTNLQLSADQYYFIVDKDMKVIWHS